MTSRNVDFLRSSTFPRGGALLLAIGLIALAGAIAFDQKWALQRQAVERTQQVLAQANAKSRLPRQVRPLTSAEKRRHLAELEVAQPWLSTLRAIEQATNDPIYLLSLAIEPSTGAVKLEAEAASFDQAVAYVQQLNDGGSLGNANLLSHKQVDTAQGTMIRFSVATQWLGR